MRFQALKRQESIFAKVKRIKAQKVPERANEVIDRIYKDQNDELRESLSLIH